MKRPKINWTDGEPARVFYARSHLIPHEAEDMETTSSKSSESKVIASRPVIDISKLICIQKGGFREHVVPFITCRTRGSVSGLFIRWLQYSREEALSEKDFLYRAWSRFQTPSEYRNLGHY